MKLNVNNMAGGFCLIKEKAEKFISKLGSEISPDKLNEMSTKERTELFESLFGKDDAKAVNLALEKKMLAKNRESALISWVEEVTGKNSKYREEMIEMIKKNKIEREKRLFSPEEEDIFLEQLVEQKLGIGITREESKTIFELSKKFQETRDLYNKSTIYNKLSEIVGKDINDDEKKVIDNLLEKISKKEEKVIDKAEIQKLKNYFDEAEKKLKEKDKTELAKLREKIKEKKKSFKEIVDLNKDERKSYLESIFDTKEEAFEFSKKIDKKFVKQTKQKFKEQEIKSLENFYNNAEAKKKLSYQKEFKELSKTQKYTEFLKNKKKSVSEIAKMTESGRMDYLKNLFDEETSKIISKKIDDILLRGRSNTEYVNTVKKYLNTKELSPEIKKNLDSYIDDLVKSRENPLEFGASKVAIDDYMNKLKMESQIGYKDLIKTKSYGQILGKSIKDIASISKSTLSTLDNSFIGRQGIKGLYRGFGSLATGDIRPMKAWLNSAGFSFKALYKKGIKGEDALRGLRAEILSRPNSINGIYRNSGLAIGEIEEAFPENGLKKLIGKFPVLGKFAENLAESSEEAFTGAAYRMRADMFDNFFDNLKKNGFDLLEKEEQDKAIKGLGELVNSMTGRGSKGIGKAGEVVNLTLFSPKFLQSNIDHLTAHLFDKEMPMIVKKEAFKNLASTIGSIATILMISNAISPESVNFDPTKSDFGKIKIGDTRFDISGGLAGLVTLASRILAKTKRGITGTPAKFGEKDVVDLIGDFLENKTSPIVRTLLDISKGENFGGDEINLGEIQGWKMLGKNMFIPLPAKNAYENATDKSIVKDKKWYNSSMFYAVTLLDGLGIGANTYKTDEKWSDPSKEKWSKKETQEMLQFKQQKGEQIIENANKEYNDIVNKKILELSNNEKFKNLSNEEKMDVIDKLKSKTKTELFEKYKFKKEVKKIDKKKENLYNNLIK